MVKALTISLKEEFTTKMDNGAHRRGRGHGGASAVRSGRGH